LHFLKPLVAIGEVLSPRQKTKASFTDP